MWHQVPFFESLVWLDLGLNPGLPGHGQTLYTLDQWSGKLDSKEWNYGGGELSIYFFKYLSMGFLFIFIKIELNN